MRHNLESMKSLYTLVLGLILSGSAFAQPTSDEFPNWTHTDLDGVEHTLYDYLDDGKTVVIDIFTTWCPNCVNSLPALEEIWDAHGPNGDNTVVIFSFERDEDTDNEAAWAENNEVTTPVFANATATMATWNTNYQPNYFVICPDRSHELIVGAVNSDASDLLGLIDGCSSANSILERPALLVTLQTTIVNENLTFYSSDSNASYRIVNLSGQEVMQGKTGARVDVSTASLSSGLYLLQVLNEGEVLTKKFLKR